MTKIGKSHCHIQKITHALENVKGDNKPMNFICMKLINMNLIGVMYLTIPKKSKSNFLFMMTCTCSNIVHLNFKLCNLNALVASVIYHDIL
jgi:hypothetical protein